jgi:hypothetical protein
MSDQTPRVPELWWSPSTGALHANRLASEKYLQLNSTWRRDLPADAVKLGDVEALRAELNRLSIEVIAATSTLETVEAERDLALWLHAEAQWSRDLARELLADVSQRFDAERDLLLARIDVALANLKTADDLSSDFPPTLNDWSAYNSMLIRARAALQGDQEASRG